MNLYNLLNGVNQATFFILPMLGKHPDEYPRFRDCWATNDERSRVDTFGIPCKKQDITKKEINVYTISVYTRVGGGNREDYQKEINELRAMPEFITDFDDDFDNTFATFVFNVPKKWEKDYDLVLKGEIKKISEEYKENLYKIFPKIENKLKKLFMQP